jgi:hypothetical protein
MLYGSTLTEKLRPSAGGGPAPSRWVRAALSLAAAMFGYGAIDEQTTSGRVWLVSLSLVGIAAVGSEVVRRRAQGERWSRRGFTVLAALSVAFVVGGVQAALFHLQ